MHHQCCTTLQNPVKPIDRTQNPSEEKVTRMLDPHNKYCQGIDSKKDKPAKKNVVCFFSRRELGLPVGNTMVLKRHVE